MFNMKKGDKLQDRKLYRVAYEFSPKNLEIVNLGADKNAGYFQLRSLAEKIFANKYENFDFSKVKVL